MEFLILNTENETMNKYIPYRQLQIWACLLPALIFHWKVIIIRHFSWVMLLLQKISFEQCYFYMGWNRINYHNSGIIKITEKKSENLTDGTVILELSTTHANNIKWKKKKTLMNATFGTRSFAVLSKCFSSTLTENCSNHTALILVGGNKNGLRNTLAFWMSSLSMTVFKQNTPYSLTL